MLKPPGVAGWPQPEVTVQWEAPTAEDLNNIVSAFHISIDPDTGQIHMVDARRESGAHWTIDFMELPESANGFTRLLVFTDRVSKVVVLAPVQSATAVEVAEVFVQQVFCWFGMPQTFFSDKGPEFRSAVFTSPPPTCFWSAPTCWLALWMRH